MKNLYLIVIMTFCIMACSNDDNASNNQMQNPTDKGEYSLILNGAGFTDERVELYSDTINSVGVGILYSGSDDFGNSIQVVLGNNQPGTYSIVEYDESMTNPSGYQADAASFRIGNDRYRSEDGTFTRESSGEVSENCFVLPGSLNINFTLNGDDGDVLNVQGTFGIRGSGCDE